MDRVAAGDRRAGDPEGGARARRRVSRGAPRRRARAGRGAAAIDARLEPVIAQLTQQYTDELPEEHERRVAAVARGVRSGQGVHRGVSARRSRRAIRAPTTSAGAAVLPWVLVRLAHYKGIDGKFRLFRYGHWIPAQWREFHELYEFARMRGWQREQLGLRRRHVFAAGRLRRAGVPEDAAADAARFRQLHARPGRMGREAARGLGAVADAGAAAGRRRDVSSSISPARRDCAATIARIPAAACCSSTRAPLLAHRRADALAARAGRRPRSRASCRRASSGCC